MYICGYGNGLKYTNKKSYFQNIGKTWNTSFLIIFKCRLYC